MPSGTVLLPCERRTREELWPSRSEVWQPPDPVGREPNKQAGTSAACLRVGCRSRLRNACGHCRKCLLQRRSGSTRRGPGMSNRPRARNHLHSISGSGRCGWQRPMARGLQSSVDRSVDRTSSGHHGETASCGNAEWRAVLTERRQMRSLLEKKAWAAVGLTRLAVVALTLLQAPTLEAAPTKVPDRSNPIQ